MGKRRGRIGEGVGEREGIGADWGVPQMSIQSDCRTAANECHTRP